VGVQRLLAEGPARTWARHAALAAATEAGLEALGLRLVAPLPYRSGTVTAAWLPEGVEWSALNAALRGRGLAIAGGQGKWAGRILRFGHMGAVALDELTAAIEVMSTTLPDFGVSADAAAASAATRDAYRSATEAAA